MKRTVKALNWAAGAAVSDNARRVLPQLLDAYYSEAARLTERHVSPKRLHELRLATKHLRYTLDLFRPIFGRRIQDLLALLRETQSLLGEVSDATATKDCLKELGIAEMAESRQLAFYLEHRADKKAGEFREFWNNRWLAEGIHARWRNYLIRYAGRGGVSTRVRSRAHAT